MQTLQDTKTLNVHSIESFGTYDGPGIRMVVFLQGCEFRCLYCGNADTFDCDAGDKTHIDDLFKEATHMKSYFSNGGGITFSGGEPCLQAKKLIPLMKRLKEEGMHICLDTNGHILNHYVEEMLQYVDLVLLDVKHIDSDQHEKITGRTNENTLKFAEYLEANQKQFWLRYVLVPDLSDQLEALHRLGQHFQDYTQLQKVEIQPYHKLGVHKWELMGMEYQLPNTPQNTPEQIAFAKDIYEQYFRDVVVN
ncbi:pyruvate formate-lyase-activating protein [Reichenbachiella versicolor]|uniref:pyruvate formate-lyase-activating protein n=1 Tax=Reichenbachiella versicolor TaxID=1821036 RepID=UPI000D6E1CB5|nr:pyruvate formate-lyase-activating protein [Reichenbachiella versicolor]